MLDAGNEVLIVSKPHIDCISRLCERLEPWKENILFRFTIGSTSDDVLRLWEPNAPPYMERMGALILAYKKGFKTSVSSEPYLDNNVGRLISEASPYVRDAIWIGKMNKVKHRLLTNGANKEVMDQAELLSFLQRDESVVRLYESLKYHPKVKWKDSIKQVVGLDRPTEKGLDI
jgi:DNA repair photolyase